MSDSDNTEAQRYRVDMEYKPPEYEGIKFPMFKPLTTNIQERLEAIRNLDTRADDILLAAYPRSGTHWVWEMINMMVRGNSEYLKANKETAFLEMVDELSALEDMESPRVLNTHIPFKWLPRKHVENGGKIVHVIRNPKDQLISWYYFLTGRYESLRKTGWKDFFDKTMNGDLKMYGGWFAYEKEFERVKSYSIHVLHYENLKLNTVEETRRLAEFLNVNLPEKLLYNIINKCQFTNLKDADKNIKVKNNYRATNHYRKGEIGDWKNLFTVSQNERFDDLYKAEMSASNVKVKFDIE